MNKKGFAFVTVLSLSFVLFAIMTSLITLTNNEIRMTRQRSDSLGAFFLADAGIEKAIYELTMDENYTGDTGVSLGKGVYDITVNPLPDDQKQINVTGYVPDKTSPIAERSIQVIVEKPTNPIDADSAVSVYDEDADITISGNADIDGNGEAGISIPGYSGDMVTVNGNPEISGNPAIQEDVPPPSFEDVFGLNKAQMKALAAVYYNPAPNIPNPALGITWIEGDANYTSTPWIGEGILIVTGDLRISGGTFDGIIYVMGDTDASNGSAVIRGALFAGGDASFGGGVSITYDPDVINPPGGPDDYPYEVVSWKEL